MANDLPAHEIKARAEFAETLAREVGRSAAAFRQNASAASLVIENKGHQDFVTIADRQTEDTIRSAIAEAFPHDGFMGEETGGAVNTDAVWVVDPIDGTTNFLRGFRHWGVSIAFVLGEHIEIGVIYDATRDKVFSAIRGNGAFSEGKAVHASTLTDPNKAIAVLGHSRRTDFDVYIQVVRELYARGIDYRRMGAAAIGLVRVADGTADLYYENHLNSWDMLAGALIAHEAGAAVLMPPIADILLNGGAIVANANGLTDDFSFLHKQLASSCQQL